MPRLSAVAAFSQALDHELRTRGAVSAAQPKLRYTPGGLAGRLRLLSKFAPAGMVDAGIQKDLWLDAVVASPGRSPVLERQTLL